MTANWLSELFEALERHTQAVQANTAAVNSLLAAAPPGVTAGPGSVQRRLAEQLEEARAIAERLEQLRGELAPFADSRALAEKDR